MGDSDIKLDGKEEHGYKEWREDGGGEDGGREAKKEKEKEALPPSHSPMDGR